MLDKILNPKWSQHWMRVAEAVSEVSAGPNTRIGALLIDVKNNLLVATGHNGPPSGFDDAAFKVMPQAERRKIVRHAERNVIDNYHTMVQCLNVSPQRSTELVLVTTMMPCSLCARYIRQANEYAHINVVAILGRSEYIDTDFIEEGEAGQRILRKAGIHIQAI